ncbi:transcriptional regulator [Actinocrispum wychmicini]|uniref:Transcriptional regulator n=1 Tax=Actinocrispum wychmicini TaxID=1213861 RepID=A0A4R2JYH5_9PSEU|nr:transcriptional regulator [Actinocrispum wychmicini]
MEITFGILGRVALRIGGELQEKWGRPREHAILATLLLYPNRTVPIATLLEWVWSGERRGPQDPVSTLHTYATRLRRSLDRLSPRPLLSAANGGYLLEVDKSLIDYHQFRALIAQAREFSHQNEAVRARDCARQALALWRGRPLDDISSEPAEAWRTRVIQDEWLPANTTLLAALIAAGQFEDALVQLNELQIDYPDDVNLVKLRLSTLHGLSRSLELNAYYINMRQRFRRDADDQAMEHLRRHHDRLVSQTAENDQTLPAAPLLVPRQLPHDVPKFVGRRALIDALDVATVTADKEAGPSGIVIVDGMAGVGKTALVVHWGHRVRKHFPGGDLYVNLNGFSPHQKIPQSTVVDDFLLALGYPPDSGYSPRSKELLLSQLFAERRALVILDNARSTDHVQRLIPLLTNCLVVVTSRQRLTALSTATGARRIRVDPMTPVEGIELLSARLDLRHELAPDVQAHLADLCHGLPLIITILTDHVGDRRSAQLSTFVRNLTIRDLITEIGQDEDELHTATAFFMWSYQALAAPERRLFRLLGLHPGTDMSTETARVYDDRTPMETRRSLRILVGAHLLESPHAFDRFQFHDLIREFSLTCAEQDEPAEQRRAADLRIVSHYLATATAAHKTLYPGQPTAPGLSMESPVPGLTFADAEHAKAWFDQERMTAVAVVKYAADRGLHAHAWRLADMIATVFDRKGSYADSQQVRALAVSSAAAAGEREAEASSLAGLGMVLTVRGELVEAERALLAALRFAEETHHLRGQGSTLTLLGRLTMRRGDFAAAAALFDRCLRVNQQASDQEGLAWAHCLLGEALIGLDQHDEALVHLHQAQFHAQRIDERSVQATALLEIGSVYRDRDDYASAVAYSRQALDVISGAPFPDFAISIRVRLALAEITAHLAETDDAYEHARRAIEISQQTRNLTAEAQSWDVLGQLYYTCGELYDAATAWQRAAEIYAAVGPAVRAAEIRANLRRIQEGQTKVPYARTSSLVSKPALPDLGTTSDIADH